MGNRRVLIISDLHAPYYHKDTVPFLRAIKKKYNPDRIILTGDEIDGHTLSFHDTDPDLPFSPSSELEKSIEHLEPIYELFPKADVMESNHGSLVYRRGKHGGIPRSVFRSYREILRAPKGWKWYSDLIFKLPGGKKCYVHHGKSANGISAALAEGMNVIQGHYHSIFEIRYIKTARELLWALTTGCMIDDKSMAFGYNKLHTKRPVIGCSIILEGQPKLLPLIVDDNGDWIGKVV